jgi:hypothetical protein
MPLMRKMVQSKYLTGDSAAINEFLDKFDVRQLSSYRLRDCNLTLYRSSYLIAMVKEEEKTPLEPS